MAETGSPERVAYEEAVEVFEEVIAAACEPFGIEPYRADEINEPGEIPEQIFEALRDEQLVIADLTGANPNVMYELGIRHVTGKCTIPIGERGRLPFDVNTIRTVQFKRSPAGLVAAKKKLAAAIGSSLANDCKPSVAARVLNGGFPTATDDPELPELPGADGGSGADGDDESLGLLEAMVELEESLPHLSERLSSMTQLNADIAELTSNYSPRLADATKPAHKLGLAANYAKELDPLASTLDQESVEFASRVGVLSAAIEAIKLHVDRGGASDEDEQALRVMVDTMANAAAGAKAPMQSYRDSVLGLDTVSRELRPVVRLLGGALQRILDSLSDVESWSADLPDGGSKSPG